MKNKKIIIDPVLATETHITMWADTSGRLFQTSDMAAWSSCTHVYCKNDGCGELTPKRWTHCKKCREANELKRYLNRTLVRWTDGPVYSETVDEYFFDDDELADYLEDHECDDLRLRACRRSKWTPVDVEALIDAYEDFPLPEPVQRALDALNKAMEENPPDLWEPAPERVDIKLDKQSKKEEGLAGSYD
jgi:hypothetical protein